MGETIATGNNHRSPHHWKFFRAGGFDQVRLETGKELASLDQLDQKLWLALSCPVKGLEFDQKTLELIDTDGDGRIRVPEIIAAVSWATSLLKNSDDLLKSSAELPLAAINESSPEGINLLNSARHILASLGKEGAPAITVTDTTDTAAIFSQTNFNGDGIIPPDAADDQELRLVIEAIMECLGEEIDRSGKPGISQEKADQFFADLDAYAAWQQEGKAAKSICPLGEDTAAALAALDDVCVKVEDYFARCRLAAFDSRALTALNGQETEYIAIAENDLSAQVAEVAGFPLAMIAAGRPLPLRKGVNPAWATRLDNFATAVVTPLLGDRQDLTETEWQGIQNTFSPYREWLARKAGAAVEILGIDRVREIAAGKAKKAIDELLEKDRALETEFNAIASVDRLVRYHRDLYVLLKNFVSFSDFYTRKDKALFQAGTLYLDGRSCDLCVRVTDMD